MNKFCKICLINLILKPKLCFLLVLVVSKGLLYAQNINETKLQKTLQKAEQFQFENHYDSAIFCFNLAYKIAEKNQDRATCVKTFASIAENYLYLSEYPKSKEYLDSSMQMGRQYLSPDHLALSDVYNIRGWYFERKGDYENALSFFRKTLFIRNKKLPAEHLDMAQCYFNIASCYGSMEEYDLALQNYDVSLQIRKKRLGDNHPVTAKTYSDIGWCYGRMQDHKRQLFYYNKVLQIRLQTLGEMHLDVAIIYHNLGWVYGQQQNFKQAEAFYKKSLHIKKKLLGLKHKRVANGYVALGALHKKSGNLLLALGNFQQALMAVSLDFEDTDMYKNPTLSNILTEQDMLVALRHKALALEQYFQETSRLTDINLSLITYQLAVNLIDSMRLTYTTKQAKQSLLTKSTGVYEGAIRVAYQIFQLTKSEEYLHKAFYFAEKNKAFLLLENLQDMDAKHLANIPDHLLAQERQLKSQIFTQKKMLYLAHKQKDTQKVVQFNNEIFELNQGLEATIAQLENEYPTYYSLKHDLPIASIEDIQAQLDEKSAFIAYFMGDSALFSFIISKNNYNVHQIEGLNDLQIKLASFIELINTTPNTAAYNATNLNNYQQLANQLYRELLGLAVKDMPRSIDRLIIVPDGAIHFLPMELLISEIKEQLNYRNLAYLCRQFALTYHYSGTLWYETVTKTHSYNQNQCLAIAPCYDLKAKPVAVRGALSELRGKQKLVDLPGAQQEVSIIANFIDGSFLLGDRATEYNFKTEAKHYGVIHLAMHGFANHENPMYSRLVFTKKMDTVEDGTLYAYELYNMNLPAELVVLSACESGAGTHVRGEGLMSLARGFIHSGVASVLQTQWNANDWSTAKLMTYFYEGLSKGLSKDYALQQAKLKYLQSSSGEYIHPFYWGGFVLSGDHNAIQFKKSNWSIYWVGFLVIVVFLAAIFWVYKWKRGLFRRKADKIQ